MRFVRVRDELEMLSASSGAYADNVSDLIYDISEDVREETGLKASELPISDLETMMRYLPSAAVLIREMIQRCAADLESPSRQKILQVLDEGLAQSLEELNAGLCKIDKEKASLLQEIEEKKEAYQAAAQETQALREQIEDAKAQVRACEGAVRQTKEKIDNLHRQVEQLEKEQEEFAGIQQGLEAQKTQQEQRTAEARRAVEDKQKELEAVRSRAEAEEALADQKLEELEEENREISERLKKIDSSQAEGRYSRLAQNIQTMKELQYRLMKDYDIILAACGKKEDSFHGAQVLNDRLTDAEKRVKECGEAYGQLIRCLEQTDA